MKENNKIKVVLVIAFRGFRDPEYFIPKNILEEAGLEVYTASNKKGLAIGAEGGEAEVDFLISGVDPRNFDGIVFVGGPGCLESLDKKESYELIKEVVSQKKILAAICISPVILAKAGVLKDKKATVWSSKTNKKPVRILKDNGVDYQEKSVVKDGVIITAIGPKAAEEFGKVVLKALS